MTLVNNGRVKKRFRGGTTIRPAPATAIAALPGRFKTRRRDSFLEQLLRQESRLGGRFATSRVVVELGSSSPFAPHDRHKPAKAEKRTSRSHFPRTDDLPIVTADNSALFAVAMLRQTYTLTGDSAAVPPAAAHSNYLAAWVNRGETGRT